MADLREVEEAVTHGKEMRTCTYKGCYSHNGVSILQQNLAQISLIIAEILLFV